MQGNELIDLRLTISKCLRKVPSSSATVLRLRFGLDGVPEHSRHECAKRLDITKVAVLEAESSGIVLLRNPPMSNDLEMYWKTGRSPLKMVAF